MRHFCFLLSLIVTVCFGLPVHAATIFQDVPFTAQAPFGQWNDPRQENACEEASALMAVRWATGQSFSSKSEALQAILSLAAFEQQHYGSYLDTSAADTVERIFKSYFHYKNVEVKQGIGNSDIIAALADGAIVIVPMNGRKLHNPFYTQPGPEHHMLLVRGYDAIKKEFITNDPGTRRGQGFRYPAAVLEAAIRDYPTSNVVPAPSSSKNVMIVVRTVGAKHR